MKHRSAIIAAIVGVALAALVALFAFSPKGQDPASASASPLVGKLAPELVGTTADGQSFDLDKHRGQWVLVNFFATWCPPCVAEQPELVALSERNAGELQIVSVAYEDTAEKVQEFFAERGGEWPALVADTGRASIDYGVIKLPESYLVDPSGKVVHKFIGGVTAADVEKLMAESSTAGSTPDTSSPDTSSPDTSTTGAGS